MRNLTRVVTMFSVAALIGAAMPVFAESAPVYDADSLPQQFEGGPADQAQDLPPPPPPGQEGAFVPTQSAPSDAGMGVSSSLSMEQRMGRVEQIVNNMLSNGLSTRMDSLQDQVQALRGQVEQLTHDLQLAQNQLKTMYAVMDNMDKRLAQPVADKPVAAAAPEQPSDATVATADNTAAPTVITPKPMRKIRPAKPPVAAPAVTTTVAAVAAKPKSTDNQPNVAEEQQIYQTAYNQIKAKKYEDAVSTLQGMLKKYPSGQFASNAHYWLGELFGLMGKSDQALTEFSTVLATYPDSPRLSDAQLKVGLIYASQSKWTDAKNAFRKVINHYPGTSSARLAAEHLKQIKQAGN